MKENEAARNTFMLNTVKCFLRCVQLVHDKLVQSEQFIFYREVATRGVSSMVLSATRFCRHAAVPCF
jgi:hypothetical protein